MRLAFMGTPAFSVPALDALVAAGHEIAAVYSQPPRKAGRGHKVVPSPVHARAEALGIEVRTPLSLKSEDEQAAFAALDLDCAVVVAYGLILPKPILDAPRRGCLNIHASLLPRWRGAAPIQRAILAGDSETGVCIMQMEAGLDTGPVLLERSIPIGLLENAGQLAARLAALTAELLVEALPRIEAAGPGPEAERLARLGVRRQGEEGITYARMLTKEDYRIDWSQPALTIHRRVMGLHPGAHTSWGDQRLRLLATEPLVERLADRLSPEAASLCGRDRGGPQAGEPPQAEPGTVLAVEPGVGAVLATGGCPLLLREAQLAGRSPRKGQALLQQLDLQPGDRLGDASEPGNASHCVLSEVPHVSDADGIAREG
jgi:methionyl-tRNA formyltransferase